MAKPNYSFEKRQRELAKKKKQEEKDARKREARSAASAITGQDEPDNAAEPVAEGAPPPAGGPKTHLRRKP